MHEQFPAISPAVDPVDSIVASAVRLAGELRGAIPGWLAAELTIGQLRLLGRLSRHGATSMSGIADWLGTGLPSVTGAVDRLERHGLVERRHATDDRRVVEVHLTDRGNELIGDMAGVRMDVIRTALAVLDPAELAELERLLATIVARREGPRS